MPAFLAVLILTLFPLDGGATPQTPQSNLRTYPPEVVADAVIHDIVSYAHHVDAQAFGTWLVDVAAREAQEAAQRAAEAARAPAPVTAPRTTGGVGSCTGFVIPDYIIQRESGGNPFIQNPTSSAFGCAQTLLEHYYGGSCSGLDPYTIEGQRQCVYILSNGGTNLAPWAL